MELQYATKSQRNYDRLKFEKALIFVNWFVNTEETRLGYRQRLVRREETCMQ